MSSKGASFRTTGGTECRVKHYGNFPVLAPWQSGGEREMLLIREEAPHDVCQVRMISSAVLDRPDEAFMIRVLQPAAVAGAAGMARYRVEFDAVVERVS